MPLPFYQVDAFAATPFTGNPAAVCLLQGDRDADWMQGVAAEMNLSETAFLAPQDDEATYRLRWFTPTDEVALCGHATLASAHALWTHEQASSEAPLHFETASGRLTTRHDDGWIWMDVPTDPVAPTDPPAPLLDALGGTTPKEVGWSGRDYLVRLPDADAVRTLQPVFSSLSALEEARGTIVTAPAPADDVDFVSRFFAPRVGVPEDPVTGSAHCALGPYWAARTGHTTLTGRQVSARGGTVRVRLDAPDAGRVTLGGQAVTVVEGRLNA
ncbi:PhzF family phenazine biosynthesis protein [Salinibacter altiplanensis]|uniref:PhzF family phenazine biosynthesis protein n=1 Tax=Salinibacter altiplanensis TaxID=1803181 RepID=UPI000C9F061C|nr:PhzF family phenazine biosynthesis protein [Salinibacter altiplanensis]